MMVTTLQMLAGIVTPKILKKTTSATAVLLTTIMLNSKCFCTLRTYMKRAMVLIMPLLSLKGSGIPTGAICPSNEQNSERSPLHNKAAGCELLPQHSFELRHNLSV